MAPQRRLVQDRLNRPGESFVADNRKESVSPSPDTRLTPLSSVFMYLSHQRHGVLGQDIEAGASGGAAAKGEYGRLTAGVQISTPWPASVMPTGDSDEAPGGSVVVVWAANIRVYQLYVIIFQLAPSKQQLPTRIADDRSAC